MSKYATFSGRAKRKEYWMFVLINFLFGLIASVLDYFFGTIDTKGGFGTIYI
jgi:uncharacterized membrane protein YhaH (DUF805 family)